MKLKQVLVLLLIAYLQTFLLSAQDTTQLIASFNSSSSPEKQMLASQKLANFYQQNSQLSNALIWAQKGLRFAKKIKNDSLSFTQYNLVSDLQREDGNYDEAISILEDYLKDPAFKKNIKETAIAYNDIGVLQGYLGNFELQTTNYIQAQKIYNNLGLQDLALNTEANLAEVLLMQGSYKEGIKSLNRIAGSYKKQQTYAPLAGIYGNLTTAYLKLKITDSALYCSQQQIFYARISKDPDLQFKAWQKYGALGSRIGKTEALKAANDSMLHYAVLQNDANKTALSYSNIGMYHAMVTGDMQLAKTYFEKALVLNRQSGDKTFIVNSLNNLATAYNMLGENEKAFKLMEEAYQLKDQIISDAGQEKIIKMQTQFQSEKKDANIQLLNTQNTLQKRNISLLALGLLILAVIIIFLFKLTKSKQRHNSQLSKLNNDLTEANHTKAKLFSIISHDLRSPISQVYQFLRLQQMENVHLDEAEKSRLNQKVQTATGSLLETMEELLLWSKTQMQHFDPKITKVNLYNIIIECTNLLQLNIDAKNIKMVNNVAPTQIVETDGYFLQTILRNLLQNALKASPVDASIFIYWKNNKLQIVNKGNPFTQKDYELALNKELDKNSLSGLGLKLAAELSGKINAVISFGENKQEETHTFLEL